MVLALASILQDTQVGTFIVVGSVNNIFVNLVQESRDGLSLAQLSLSGR